MATVYHSHAQGAKSECVCGHAMMGVIFKLNLRFTPKYGIFGGRKREKGMKMIRREMEKEIVGAASRYPSVTVLGPRQAGKTTLIRSCFPGYAYANLEDPETRMLAEMDYKAFFRRYPSPVIIDEIQRVPKLISAIQVMIDAEREKVGRFLLAGSQQLSLAETVSQSLAGRTTLLTLLPLSVSEILSVQGSVDTDELLFRGMMPELYRTMNPVSEYYRNYFRTYVERDLRQLINVKDVGLFERFLSLLAGRIGQPVNVSALANETGVSSTTLTGWLTMLESSYILFRLQPWFSNLSKRLVKSPKLYFTEPGLAAYLLGIESAQQLLRDPLRGHLFENLVVVEVLKHRLNRGLDPNLFFLRTEKQVEVDLVLRHGRMVQPMEIKSAMVYTPEFAKHLRAFCAKEDSVVKPMVVYDGDDLDLSDGTLVRNFRNMEFGYL